jgi:hypothetical protein
VKHCSGTVRDEQRLENYFASLDHASAVLSPTEAADPHRALALRVREDFRQLALADCVIVSFGKSGRTWLRVMLSRVYQVRHGLARRHLLAFDNLHNKVRAIPKIFFTHDSYLRDYVKQGDGKAQYRDKKLILMVRDPADVAVSQYFQWKFRIFSGNPE